MQTNGFLLVHGVKSSQNIFTTKLIPSALQTLLTSDCFIIFLMENKNAAGLWCAVIDQFLEALARHVYWKHPFFMEFDPQKFMDPLLKICRTE